MVTIECPWCTEPVRLDSTAADVLVCDTCTIVVEIAPDPAVRKLEHAA